ncbi:unnamed protein product, partial [Tetraodon nigroviridis]
CDVIHDHSFYSLYSGTGTSPFWRNLASNLAWPVVQRLPQLRMECLQLNTFDIPPYYSTSFDSFRNTVEDTSLCFLSYKTPQGMYDLHNLAHLFLNRTGGQTYLSLNDLIIVLLHTFTDTIFDEWLSRFHIATGLTMERYALVFGANYFASGVLQAIILSIVVSDKGLGLGIIPQRDQHWACSQAPDHKEPTASAPMSADSGFVFTGAHLFPISPKSSASCLSLWENVQPSQNATIYNGVVEAAGGLLSKLSMQDTG